MHDTLWTDAETEIILLHWREGFSAAQCAKQLAKHGFKPRSRNAVIGRLHRLGLAASRRQPGAAKPRQRSHFSKAKSARVKRKRSTKGCETASVPHIDPLLTTLDAANIGCRWVCDTFEWGRPRYCGHATVDRAWCAEHRARVYIAAPKKRRQGPHDTRLRDALRASL